MPDSKNLFAMRGSRAWLAWLHRYADFAGVPLTVAIDLALRAQAKRDGFLEPMPKRTGPGTGTRPR